MERQKLIIIGAGGLGRVIHDILLKDSEVHHRYILAGFLDTRSNLKLPTDLHGSILCSPLIYKPSPEDIFLPAVGDPTQREKFLAHLINCKVDFYSYTHRASIAARCTIGKGIFIGPGAAISTDCEIGDYSYIDSYTIIGHDAKIGRNCTIGAMCFFSGGVIAEEGVTIHPRSTIAKDVILGKYCTVGIGSVVLKDVPPYATVFGNPARIIYSKDS